MNKLLRWGLLGLASLAAAANTAGAAESQADVSHPEIAIFRNGVWVIDSNNDKRFTPFVDREFTFGQAGDYPVAFSSAFCGSTPVIVHGTTWTLLDDRFGRGPFVFGEPGMIPVLDGFSLVSFLNGLWHIDNNRDGFWDERYLFGGSWSYPVMGSWKGNGDSNIGVFDVTSGWWFLDASGDGQWTERDDVKFHFGQAGDIPVVGDFNRDRPGDEIGTFRAGTWFIDWDGNRRWDPRRDKEWAFGQAGDIPVLVPDCS